MPVRPKFGSVRPSRFSWKFPKILQDWLHVTKGDPRRLELRPSCEHCKTALPPASLEARICSFECTFCAKCVDEVLGRLPQLWWRVRAAADSTLEELER